MTDLDVCVCVCVCVCEREREREREREKERENWKPFPIVCSYALRSVIRQFGKGFSSLSDTSVLPGSELE